MDKKRAIVLSGGGARGSYQVGVLKAISEVARANNITPQVSIYTGISAGAINAVCMASHANDFHAGVDKLVHLWSQITSEQVFASDFTHMGKIAAKLAAEVSLGGLFRPANGQALLDTSPLRKLISNNVNFDAIDKHIESGHLFALAVTATDYYLSESTTFIQGHPKAPQWAKTKRVSKKATITSDHVMASSAIPLLFPPIAVGQRYFGDGSVRNSSPCAPSIYLGADELLVVGVRLKAPTQEDERALRTSTHPPSMGRVINVLLNAVLLDGIEADVERLVRMNDFVDQVPAEFRDQLSYRKVDAHLLSPSVDIGTIALQHADQLPKLIHYLLKGLGQLEDAREITSYLLFDPGFCKTLIEVGYQDGMAHRDTLLAFLT